MVIIFSSTVFVIFCTKMWAQRKSGGRIDLSLGHIFYYSCLYLNVNKKQARLCVPGCSDADSVTLSGLHSCSLEELEAGAGRAGSGRTAGAFLLGVIVGGGLGTSNLQNW